MQHLTGQRPSMSSNGGGHRAGQIEPRHVEHEVAGISLLKVRREHDHAVIGHKDGVPRSAKLP